VLIRGLFFVMRVRRMNIRRNRPLGDLARRAFGAFALAAAACALLISPAARAEQAAEDVVRQYQAALLTAMKQASFDARLRTLQAPVTRAFDLAFVAQRAAGPSWAGFTDQQKARYVEAFARYSLAQHASRFKGYAGERFEMVGNDAVGQGYVRVRTQLVTRSDRVALDYLLGRRGGAWKIVDVFAKGTISEVATRRADFAPVIRAQGAEGLIRELDAKTAAARTL
jgi:phospholipid transport system substrate-binding protein